jgi:hypothetical protein
MGDPTNLIIRSTNNIQLRTVDNPNITTGTIAVGGNDLQLYSKTDIKFILSNNNNKYYY